MISKVLSLFISNEIVRKSSVSLFVRSFGSLFSYLFLLLVTRNIGAASWGVFVLFLSLLNISSIFSRLGIDMLTLKLVAASKFVFNDIKSIYFSSFRIVSISSCIVSLLIYLFSDYIALTLFKDINFRNIVRLVAFTLPFFSIICVNEKTFQGLKMIKEFTFFQTTSKMFLSFVLFLFLYYIFSFSEFYVVVASYSFGLILVFFVSTWMIIRIIRKGTFSNFVKSKNMFSQSLPMMVSSSVMLLMAWVDSLMIGGFWNEYEVGIYSVAVKVSFVTSVTLNAVNSILAPKISESFNNNNISEFKNIVRFTTKLIFYSTLPLIIVIFLFPDLLLSLFGKEFIEAKVCLLILAFSQAINCMSGSVGNILNMTGKEKFFRNLLLCSLIINIILNLLLIPKYGIEGAAIASASSLIFWNLYSVFYVYKQYGVLTMINPFRR